MMVERLTKQSYADFLGARFFAPLGMDSTRFGGTGVFVPRRSPTAYNRETGELRPWLYPFGEKDYPAAGLNSSAADLAKFFIALDAGRVLRPESLRALCRAKLNDGRRRATVSLDNRRTQGPQSLGHEGGGAAWIAHFPRALTVVVLCNLNGARADEIQYGIADLYLAADGSRSENLSGPPRAPHFFAPPPTNS